MHRVRQISREEHLAFIASRDSVSPLQCPSWGRVKAEWDSESVGWESADGQLVGAGLVLHRRLPVLRRSLAYLPEGPALPWEQVARDVPGWIGPLVAHLRRRGAFAVRMGPPVVVARWEAESVKRAVADGTAARLGDVAPDARTDWPTPSPRACAAPGGGHRRTGTASPPASRATSSGCRWPGGRSTRCAPGSTSSGGAT